MARVFERIYNSFIPLVFSHFILMKKLGVCRAREMRARIYRRMDLW